MINQVLQLGRPLVMGILNATPDSFYPESLVGRDDVAERVVTMLREGADIIDIGGCSTRPGATLVEEDEEWSRLDAVLDVVRRCAPETLLSVDTFRPAVARRSVEHYGVGIINDVGGGSPEMFDVAASLHVPYVLTMNHEADTVPQMVQWLSSRVQEAHDRGVADIILDPGFGFAKTRQQDYEVMAHLADLCRLFPDYPILVGVSRKSMLYQKLGCEPADALAATVAMNTMALEAGADILRVHDVTAAVQTARMVQEVQSLTSNLETPSLVGRAGERPPLTSQPLTLKLCSSNLVSRI